MNLVLAVKKAAESFHSAWEARLGRGYRAGISKEHWTRVKALSRRFAEQWADQYASGEPARRDDWRIAETRRSRRP